MTYSHSTHTGRRLRGGRAGAAANIRTAAGPNGAAAEALEALETRRLFATVALTNGIITVDGGGDDGMRAVVFFDRDDRVYRTRVTGAENQSFKWKDVQ